MRRASRTVHLVFVFTLITMVGASSVGQCSFLGRAPEFDSGWRTIEGELTLHHGLGGDPDSYFVDLQLKDQRPGGAGVHQNPGLAEGASARVRALALDGAALQLMGPADVGTPLQVRARIWIVPDVLHDSGWRQLGGDGGLLLPPGLLEDSAQERLIELRTRAADEGEGVWDQSLVVLREPRGDGVRLVKPVAAAAGMGRLRVHRCPAPDYESGWIPTKGVEPIVLEHRLGGPWASMKVYLETRVSDRSRAVPMRREPLGLAGASWSHLNDHSIVVTPDSSGLKSEIHLMIWIDNAPAYDSGWRSMGGSHSITLAHDLGADPASYEVDLEYMSVDPVGTEIRIYNYGMDVINAPSGLSTSGAAWWNLTTNEITVDRGANDYAADRVRVRLWHAVAPGYESGWITVPPGTCTSLTHDLGTDPDALVVELDQRATGFGRNHLALGGDVYTAHDGSWWRALTTNTIEVCRAGSDWFAEESRVRIWSGSVPAYTSTWLATWSSHESTFSHELGIPPERMVVEVRSKSNDSAIGTTNLGFGRDTSYVGDQITRTGFSWMDLTSTSLSAYVSAEDDVVDWVRARIWDTGALPHLIFAADFEDNNTWDWSSVVGQ